MQLGQGDAIASTGFASVAGHQENAFNLVAREREFASLRSAFAHANQGKGSLVLVSGEAGIGKTALVQEFLDDIDDPAVTTLSGACYDLTTTPPYGPWLEILERSPADERRTSLLKLITSPGRGERERSQGSFFAEMVDFLAARAASGPLIVAIEDLHWSDHASLELLRFVARSVRNYRILLIGTYRDNEIHDHPLYLLLPNLVREAAAERIDLRRLSIDEIRTFISRRYPMTDQDLLRTTRHLSTQSDGNPLYFIELLRTLELDGDLFPEGTLWKVGSLERTQVPDIIQQMVEGRIARLGNSTAAAIQLASVIGQQVPIPLWERFLESGSIGVTLRQALNSGLIREVHGASAVEFSHALVRQAIHDRIDLAERRRLHSMVADACLESAFPEPARVAYHLRQAADPRAVEWLIRAGDDAERRFANYEAYARYREALDVLRERSPTAPELAAMLLKVGRAANLLDPRQSNEYLYEARETAIACGDEAIAAVASYFLGIDFLIVGDIPRGLAYLRHGIDTLESNPELVERATKLSPPVLPARVGDRPVEGFNGVLALSLAVCGRLREAIATAERYIDPVCHDPTDHKKIRALAREADYNVHAWEALGIATSINGDVDRGRIAFAIAEETFNELDPYRMLVASFELVTNHLPYRTSRLSERERLTSIIEEQIARSHRVVPDQEATWGYEWVLLHTGRWNELRLLADSQPLPTLFDALSVSVSARARLAWYQGDIDRAWSYLRALLKEGYRTAPDERAHLLPGDAHRMAAGMALDAGDSQLARKWMTAHDTWIDFSCARTGLADGTLLWAQILAGEGEPERATVLAKHSLEQAIDPRQPLVLIAIYRKLGELATSVGDYHAAEHHLLESEMLADACQLPYERLLTSLCMAKLLATRGDRDAAAEVLQGVQETGSRLGAHPVLERAEQLGNSPSRCRLEDTYELSRREREVLALLAEGLSDRQIADRLFISHRTVMRHVSSILGKLDVDSRTAAAAKVLHDRLR